MLIDSLPELPRYSRRKALALIGGFAGGVSILGCGLRGEPQPPVPTPKTPTQPVGPDQVAEPPIQPPEPTNTPKPQEPTATPKPSEPTKTPEPTRAPELPRILREAPVYGAYTGDLFVIEGGRKVKKGGILLSHLPNDSFLVAYTILEPGSSGQRRGPALVVPRNNIAGAGFMIDNITTMTTPSLMSPEAIGGSLTAKELKDASGIIIFPAMNGLSIDTRLEPGVPSKNNLINAYTKLHQEIGVSLTKEQAQEQIERVYRGPLPEIPAK